MIHRVRSAELAISASSARRPSSSARVLPISSQNASLT
jgi:hypothetical protein